MLFLGGKVPADPMSDAAEYPIAHNRRLFRIALVRRWRALCPAYLLILVILFVGCGSASNQATVGATLATFTATPPGPATPPAVPSPTLGATATSVPVQPTATATRPSA